MSFLGNNKKIISTCFLLILSACSPSKTAEDYLTSAQQKIAQQDYNAALVQLKNAVRAEPSNPKARFELGKLQLQMGAYNGAEKEILKARERGIDDNKIFPELAKVEFKLAKYDEVFNLVEEQNGLDNDAQIVVLTYAGLSALMQGNTEQAKQYISQANELSDSALYSQLGKAYLTQVSQQYEQGLANVDKILKQNPEFSEALLLKGYLLQSQGEHVAAANTFEQYKAKHIQDITSRFLIAQNYLLAEMYDKAEPEVDALLKSFQYHPLANQMKAEIEYAKENYEQAKEYAVKAFQQNENFITAKMIAGISAYKLKNFEQSYQYLIGLKDQLPPSHMVRKLLVELQIKLGYDEEAVTGIRSLLELNEASPQMLIAASDEMIKSGNSKAAQELMEMSAQLKVDSAQDLSNQGLLELKLNNPKQGIALLEKAMQKDPNLMVNQQRLAIGYIADKQFDKARKIAQSWQQKQETKVQGLLLDSYIDQINQSFATAKTKLNQVIEIEPENLSAIYRLGLIEHKDQHFQQAFNFYAKTIGLKPDHTRALINMARLAATSNELASKVEQFYQQQLMNRPDNSYLKLGSAYAYKAAKQPEKALPLLQQIAQSTQPLPGIELALGDTLLTLGKIKEAGESYETYVRKNPKDLRATQKLFAFYERLGRYNDALTQLDKTLQFFPDNKQLVLLKGYYESLVRDNKAEQTLVRVNEQLKQNWLYQKTAGNVAYNKKDFASAVEHYQQAYKLAPTDANVVSLVKAIALNGNKQQALHLLEQHVQNNNVSLPVKVMLAGAYMNVNNTAKAIATYEQVVSESASIIAYNNLANLYLQQNNTEQALKYAEQAIKIAPKAPPILDTYAQALMANNQVQQAIKQFELALSGKNKSAEIQLHYVQALLKDKQVKLAKQQLSLVNKNKLLTNQLKALYRDLEKQL